MYSFYSNVSFTSVLIIFKNVFLNLGMPHLICLQCPPPISINGSLCVFNVNSSNKHHIIINNSSNGFVHARQPKKILTQNCWLRISCIQNQHSNLNIHQTFKILINPSALDDSPIPCIRCEQELWMFYWHR